MDWLLTVPMPVTEIVLAMELTSAEAPNTRSKLGAASALLTIVASGGGLRQETTCGSAGILGFVAVPFLDMSTCWGTSLEARGRRRALP